VSPETKEAYPRIDVFFSSFSITCAIIVVFITKRDLCRENCCYFSELSTFEDNGFN